MLICGMNSHALQLSSGLDAISPGDMKFENKQPSILAYWATELALDLLIHAPAWHFHEH